MSLPHCIRIHALLLLSGTGSSKRITFANFAELRRLIPSADQVGKLTVFNIGGNKARLVAAIHYNRSKVYIRAILTHAEYDEGRWKE
ncbi:type II toxin-antitoxin system HigB family toxin [Nodosilinea sp. FACHB-131]|uniref:type II toxin-antitoxin system HigB family toxin n=1 Tax=Leptolyngbya subtilissima TaxID=1346803 RepID=UPI0018EF4985